MYDKYTLHEYSRLRNEVVKDMPKYMKGQLKGNDLKRFKETSQQLHNVQRDLDRQYMTAKHKNDEKFWDDWARIHD